MNFLEQLNSLIDSKHEISIKPITEYQKEWNQKSNIGVKHAYTIVIDHKDTAYRFFPSSTSSIYYKRISNLFNKTYNNKLYTCGFSECANIIEIEIMVRVKEEHKWNKYSSF